VKECEKGVCEGEGWPLAERAQWGSGPWLQLLSHTAIINNDNNYYRNSMNFLSN